MVKIIIIGGPLCGKSTLASQFRKEGTPTFCSDPKTTVRSPEEGVTYLPDGLDWSAGSEYIAKNWLTMPPPWCCEGVGMVRAIRKALVYQIPLLGTQVIYLDKPYAARTPKQEQMAKAIATIWHEINTGGERQWLRLSKLEKS